jgi:hypothetical protein
MTFTSVPWVLMGMLFVYHILASLYCEFHVSWANECYIVHVLIDLSGICSHFFEVTLFMVHSINSMAESASVGTSEG